MTATVAARPAIGIVGSGISGLALAAMLSKQMGGRADITVLERSVRDRDQGYGLDLDEHGHEALRMAGVFDRYWDISRPYSQVMKFCSSSSVDPMMVMYTPNWLRWLFPARFPPQPESNREALRSLLLDAISAAGHVKVQFSAPATRVEARADGRIALFGPDGAAPGGLGDGGFDLVVDASGVHSPLRAMVVDDAQGRHYSGRMMVHGVINDPEASSAVPATLTDALQEGTLFAVCRGVSCVLQRFGAKPDDRRTAVFYLLMRPDEGGLAAEMGLPPAHSRESGIFRDEESLGRAKAWLRADMGSVGFAEEYLGAVSGLDRVTVRPVHEHGPTTLRTDAADLPLVCIGDALRNIGLGGGGNLALEDAVELAKLLVQDDAFDPRTGRLTAAKRAELSELQAGMLKRKTQFHDDRQKQRAFLDRRPAPGESAELTWLDICRGNRFFAALASGAAWCVRRMYDYDQAHGGAGGRP